MYQAILLIHVFAAICIIALVLVQQGKGASLGPAYAGGASQTVFGSRGSGSFLFRLTLSFVLIFFVTSISLNYVASKAVHQVRTISLPANKNTNSSPSTPASDKAAVPEIPTRS